MDQKEFFAWLIVGAIAGWLAGKVMGTSRQQGLLLDIVVGLAGALIGGFLFNQFGIADTKGFNIWSLFVAFTGAVILLAVIRLVSGRRKRLA
ncbi:MAG TPA: GlsB/YeaQ/YmgE family stress response membrane protein [Anaerolineales bacterium]|nr:GlsB/YeaQ/YmgE family stress response membrane protein [Anaerolineales bacterium]